MQRGSQHKPPPGARADIWRGVAGEELTLVGLEGQSSVTPTPAQRS
jgi:hypothetical protein